MHLPLAQRLFHCFLKTFALFAPLLFLSLAPAQDNAPLSGTKPLTMQGDLSAQMVTGISRFLDREIARSVTERQKLWRRDLASREAYEKSIQPNRERLRKYIGAVDVRLPVTALEYASTTTASAKIAETDRFTVYAVRWQVFDAVYGEGLLLEPKGGIKARVVAIPDADQTPEMLVGLAPGLKPEAQFARRLAENGCQVVVPVLVDRSAEWSGGERLGIMTNQPHREWIYRQAFELGRHIIGYEVQKVLSVIDWFAAENQKPETRNLKLGVAGYGEGALIAFYAAAVDTRVDATLVSGYFNQRERVWQEPIYRNIFSLLHEFGDAEIASLVAPRTLLIEHSEAPKIDGPPQPGKGRRGGAAPGKITTPDFNDAEAEFNRAKALVGQSFAASLQFIHGNEGRAVEAGSSQALEALTHALIGTGTKLKPIGEAPQAASQPNHVERQRRQVKQLEEHTQKLLRLCEYSREETFWQKLKPTTPEAWDAAVKPVRQFFWEDVIGKLPPASAPADPRSRKIRETDKWIAYEVVLDVWPDVYAWGYLLLPKDLKPGERRPVVVCQHGLEGVPEDVINEDPKSRAFAPYKAFAANLAAQGFITFSPHNPYRGQDDFRVLQRKLNPLKKTLFSVIVPQHDRIIDWLSAQPFVDPQRIAFYGLSYGGKSAMRIPALAERYCLSICSGDFNEWVWKNATVDWRSSYMFTGEYEIFEWDLGHTFNYAEMAALICTRPFMVERGHVDGVGIDERVAFEYAKVRRLYGFLGIQERATIEFFNGPHTINGIGTYEFLRQKLNWSKR